MSSSVWSYGLYCTRLLCPWDSLGKNISAGCWPCSRESSWPSDWTRLSYVSCIQVCSLPLAPPVKPKTYLLLLLQSHFSCVQLCANPRDSSPPDSSVPGILQARTLEWVAISFSNAWKWKVKVKSLSHAWLLATPWTAAHQAPPSLGFSRQEHWSGLPFPPPVHESEKWKGSRSVASDSLQPHGLQPTRPLRPWDFPGKSTGRGCHLKTYPGGAKNMFCLVSQHPLWKFNQMKVEEGKTVLLEKVIDVLWPCTSHTLSSPHRSCSCWAGQRKEVLSLDLQLLARSFLGTAQNSSLKFRIYSKMVSHFLKGPNWNNL